jgi:type IV pilus assembly protein PilC
MAKKYVYKSRDVEGQLIEGVIDADSSREVVSILHDKGLIAVSVEAVKDETAVKNKKKKKTSTTESLLSGKITQKDISVFCRQMSTMITAGVNIIEAVDDMSNMASSMKFRKVLKKVADDIKVGLAFSEALKKHPKVFNQIFVSLIRAGEEGGNLDRVLRDLAKYLEDSVKLKGKVKSASMYPLFVAVFMGLVVFGMVFFLVPKFKSLFMSLGAELPLPTKIIMFISETLISNVHWTILGVIGIIFSVSWAYKTTAGRYQIDKVILQLPIAGLLITKVILARYFQTLSTLLKSGVDVVTSLEIAGKVLNNRSAEKVIDKIRVGIIEGANLSEEMEKHTIFPKMTVRMTAIGEKSGRIDNMLEKISEYYSDEVDATVEGLSSIIEPLLIVLLGGVVGIFVLSMYLPVFKMSMAMMGNG